MHITWHRAIARHASLPRGLRLCSAVQAALAAHKPVVALESTIITHGMPYPTNLQTAREVEKIVSAGGATPATIAVMDGHCCVGLSPSQLEALAREGPERAIKCSRRDLSWALMTRSWGATTVASTLHIAHLAGIRVFVTGGVGGVHRGAEETLDISADLMELGRVPNMAVVCAGVKSILDIEKTLEVLETQGVPVVGYRTDTFPAFFTPDSGLGAPCRVDSPEEVAGMLEASLSARLPGSILVAVPNPAPAEASATQGAIEEALHAAETMGLRGQAVTPFLLERVNKATGGGSLRANIELVKNNARVGTEIAVAIAAQEEGGMSRNGGGRGIGAMEGREGGRKAAGMAEQRQSLPSTQASKPTASPPSRAPSFPPRVLVVGGAVMDVVGSPGSDYGASWTGGSEKHPRSLDARLERLEPGSSTPGRVRQKEGGVARNVAEGLARLGVPTAFLSVVAQDPAGAALASSLRALAPPLLLECGHEDVLLYQAPGPGHRTASCLVALDGGGELVAAVADMAIFRDYLTPERVVAGLETAAALAEAQKGGEMEPPAGAHQASLGPHAAPLLVVSDGNLSIAAFKALAHACASRGLPLLFEPTSVSKACLPLQAGALHITSLITPNLKELGRLAHSIREGRREGATEGDMAWERLEQDVVAVFGKRSSGERVEREVVTRLQADVEVVLGAMADEGERSVGREKEGENSSASPGWMGEKHVLVTMGPRGLVWASCRREDEGEAAQEGGPGGRRGAKAKRGAIEMRYFAVPGATPVERMVNCTGAGDTFVAGLVAALVRGSERGMGGAVAVGLAAARESVQVEEAVPRHMTWEGLTARVGAGERR